VKVHTSFSMEEFALHLSFCMQVAFTSDGEVFEHADTSLLNTPEESRAAAVKVHTSFSMEEFALHASFCMQDAVTPAYKTIGHAHSDSRQPDTAGEILRAGPEVKVHTSF
jgi:hypothetical protein